MRSLRDAAKSLDKLGLTILGISRDTIGAQKQFCSREKLPFDLLSDPKGTVVKRYGASRGFLPYPKRISLLIDDKGVLRHIWKRVDVRKHGKQVIEKVTALQKADKAKAKAK